MLSFILNDVFIRAAQSESLGAFNTSVDVKLQQWAEKDLPNKSIEIGQQVLLDEFQNLVERNQKSDSNDPIANDLKMEVVRMSRSRHKWDNKARDSLRVIQTQALQDRNVPDKQQWEAAVKFMETSLKNQLEREENELMPKTEQKSWLNYVGLQRPPIEQRNRQQCIKELEKIFVSRQQIDKTNHALRSTLDQDEITTVKKNLQAQKIDVSNEFIDEIWKSVYKVHSLKRNLETCFECRRFFYYYQKGFSDQGLDCHEVVFFWRLKRMIEITSNAIRQQISNIETRRLENEVKEILDDLSTNETVKSKLLSGKRVDLAEDLKRIREIQEKLEEFVEALSMEK